MEEDLTQINSGIPLNVDVSAKIWETSCVRKKYIWNPSICTSENVKQSESIISDSVITCGETIWVTKAI